jgi:hypothetical protein
MIGKGLIKHGFDLLLAIAREAEKAESDAVDATSFVVGLSNHLGLG